MAWRILLRNPAFAAVVVLLLSFGIGATTVMFSALDAFVLRPLPVRNPHELVRLVQEVQPNLAPYSSFPYPVFSAIRERTATLTDVIGTSELNVGLSYGDTVERVRVQSVTGNYFEALGAGALHGRTLVATEEKQASETLPAVLSYGLWRRRFGGDPAILGRRIDLQKQPFVVIGVLPHEFNGISVETAPDVRVPLSAIPLLWPDRERTVEAAELELVGRLRPGVSLEQAHAETVALAKAALEVELGKRTDLPSHAREAWLRDEFRLEPIERGVSRLRAQFSNPLIFVTGAIGVLLIIVCANVSGILLARSAARQQEIAVRIALGASGWSIARLMLGEALALSALGGAGGVALAYALLPVLARSLPPVRLADASSAAPALHMAIDYRVLLFCVAVSLLSTALVGAAPALQAARTDIQSVLRTARSTGVSNGRRVLVVAQVALCTILLGSAGLMVKTLRNLQTLDPGFDRDRLVTFSADPRTSNYTPQQTKALQQQLVSRVRELPGVVAAGISSRPLMRGTGFKTTIAAAGQSTPRSDFMNTSLNVVTPEYFETMGLRFVAGRNYTGSETGKTIPAPKIVNERFAQRFFPGLDPIGQKFGVGVDTIVKAESEIIGVVSDSKYRSLREPIQPTVYRLLDPSPEYAYEFTLNVRTKRRPEALIEPVRQALRSLDPNLPFHEIRTLAEDVEISLWNERMVARISVLLGAFAAIATGIGIFALLAYVVVQRTREIGIRMAVGARPANVIRLVGRQSLGLVFAGLVIGLAGLLAAGQWVSALLYGVGPRDALAMLGAVLFILGMGAIATLFPAIRAVRIEPAAALRQD